MRHPREEDLLLHCWEPDADVARHLASCDACRTTVSEHRTFLSELTRAEVPPPEPHESYGRALHARIAPRLAPPRAGLASALAGLLAPRRLALAGGVLALVVAAFLAGRRTAPAPIPAAARERILLLAVAQHLDRSQVVLLELLNAPDDAPAATPARAEQLVGESRLYRQAALRSGDAAMAGVLDDLERLLLDVARSPGPLSADERAALRKRVEKNGVLFKVRVLGSKLETTAARPDSRRI